jgi:hypothetical protein
LYSLELGEDQMEEQWPGGPILPFGTFILQLLVALEPRQRC